MLYIITVFDLGGGKDSVYFSDENIASKEFLRYKNLIKSKSSGMICVVMQIYEEKDGKFIFSKQ